MGNSNSSRVANGPYGFEKQCIGCGERIEKEQPVRIVTEGTMNMTMPPRDMLAWAHQMKKSEKEYYFHVNCFACRHCRAAIDANEFRIDDNILWCRKCFTRQTPPKCWVCMQRIRTRILPWLELFRLHRYVNGIKTVKKGKSFHEECFTRQTRGQCPACMEYIGLEEWSTVALGSAFHKECFRCSYCGGGFARRLQVPWKSPRFYLSGQSAICYRCYATTSSSDTQNYVKHKSKYKMTVARDMLFTRS
ncbi:muscle LIM protein Mlp84B-like [Paramacrobiotus metropolitanus]|uniref:muscle LIM protein Mlp84B-like n=1 Tax=Paramacrobiotus metropolitanus TaxID=2943436 RepID=UPI00244590D9|nr:muscle LIM protein Mlp84B-like [Paramacrobiotus metropolitanus]